MPRTCTICSHAQRAAIESALVAGTPYRRIASQHAGISYKAVERHKEHIPAAVAAAQEARAEAQALNVVRQLKAINRAALAVLAAARADGEHDLALRAIDRVHRQIELQAKLLGELSDAPQVNILLAPEWLTLRAALMAALAPFAEARVAVADALLALEASHAVA